MSISINVSLASLEMAFDSTHSFPLNPPAFENDTKCLQFIEEMTRNVAAVQEKVLAKILTKNAEVEAQPRTVQTRWSY